MDAKALIAGYSANFVIGSASGLAVLVSMALVWGALRANDPMPKRVRGLEDRRRMLKAQLLAAPKRERWQSGLGLARQWLDRFRMMSGKELANANRKMMSAGWRSKDAVVIFMFIRLCGPFITGLAAAAAFYGLNMLGLGPLMKAFCTLLGAYLGSWVPNFIVGQKVAARQTKIRRGLPDGLDLLVICSEAGLSIDAALTRVGREIGLSYPELGEELAITAVELGFLPDRRQALLNLVDRCDLPSIKGVVNTLIQTEKYGTPLAQSLRVLANEFREYRMMRAEEKAARLPAILTIPMIVFIMPALFIVLMGPAVINVMDAMM